MSPKKRSKQIHVNPDPTHVFQNLDEVQMIYSDREITELVNRQCDHRRTLTRLARRNRKKPKVVNTVKAIACSMCGGNGTNEDDIYNPGLACNRCGGSGYEP